MLRVNEPGVGTHVLMVGISYNHTAAPHRLDGSVDDVNRISIWWEKEFSNAFSPLRSLEVLTTGRFDDDNSETDFEPLARSLEEWRARVTSHPENIAVFYFAGLGVLTPSGYCLLTEAFNNLLEGAEQRPADQAFLVDELVEAFHGGPPRQLWIFDTFLPDPSGFYGTVIPRPIINVDKKASPPSQRFVLIAKQPAASLAQESSDASDFADAFLETVRAFPENLDTGALVEEIANRLSGRVEATGTGGFTLLQISQEESSAPSGLVEAHAGGSAPDLDESADPVRPYGKQSTRGGPAEKLAMPEHTTASLEQSPASSTLSAAADARSPRPDLEFLDDDAQVEVDALGRGALAVVVARRLHAIWKKSNPVAGSHANEDRSAFVMHLDAPWGGGKTTFANFVSRVLNPFGYGALPASFLRERYGDEEGLGAIFVTDPAKKGEAAPDVPEAHRRPWIVVEYNAWRMEHTAPPWWNFYQVIRKGCFGAVRQEGTWPAALGYASQPKRRPVRNTLSWVWLWLNELSWRLWTPKLIVPLMGFVVAAVIFAVLWQFGLVVSFGEQGKEKIGFNEDLWPSRIVAGLGALTVIGGVISLIMESLAPGVDPVAERIGLGRGDPLDRFRRHFHKTIHRLKRPVLVIVDDLDRCKPAVVVDLVRGIQTILRTPRVVFLILGDRNWLECAFETVHTDMAKVAGGLEQSVGARFVEKAIQLSFLLPGLDRTRQSAYVAGLLRSSVDAEARGQPAGSAVELRAAARAAAKAEPSAAFDSTELRANVLDAPEGRHFVLRLEEAISKDTPGSGEISVRLEARRQASQIVNEEIAIQAAGAPSVETETAKRLEPLAPWLPGNPRQIKRILNGIALYHAAGLQHPTFRTAERWFQLALWVVIMTEWPTTWRLLVACPELADILNDAAPLKKLATMDGAILPGSMKATGREIQRILNAPDLMALIAGKGGRTGDKLDTAAVRDLLILTPPNAKLPRLPDGEKDGDDGGGSAKRSDKEKIEIVKRRGFSEGGLV